MKHHYINDYLLTGLLLLVTSLLLSFNAYLGRVDNLLFDLGQRLQYHSTPSEIVIVAIDKESLIKLGRWPWSRHQHATLIDRLKSDGARVIGMDLIFAEPDTIDPSSDKALSEAIHHAGNVVLPVLLESNRVNGQIIETLPLSSISEYVAAMGHIHVELDNDGISRSVFLWEGLGAPVWPHFALAVLQTANIKPPHFLISSPKQSQEDFNPFIIARKDQRRISFLGRPGHVQTLSYTQALNGEFPTGMFKGKIVLIGATASGMGDFIPTPVSGLHHPMSGIEFHANIINSILHDQLISLAPNWITVMICALLAISPVVWLPRLSPTHSLLVSGLWFTTVAGISMWLPSLLSVWLPPSAALLPIALAYPIWSWRKLHTAQRFLDEELLTLHKNAAWVETAIHEDEHLKSNNKDRFQLRILQVQTASKRLRKLHEDRLETLAFIAHDLRAPLSSALMQIDSSLEHLVTPLTHALKLAEDFLHSSRAEMMDLSYFKELDLTAILYQVINDAYPIAQQKQIKLIHELPDEPVWLQGDFSLLHRAVLNLMLNAIKNSPSNATVTLALSVLSQFAIVSVTDHGPGISIEQKEKLFQRFSRSNNNTSMPTSTGLGLYFVRISALKHGGDVEVFSKTGSYTCFTLRLPLVASSGP